MGGIKLLKDLKIADLLALSGEWIIDSDMGQLKKNRRIL